MFSNGIPVSISEDDSKPVLVFKGKYADGTLAEFYADYADDLDVSGYTLGNLDDFTSDIECSFAGGCQITFEESGLASTLSNPSNHVKVCGEICELYTDSDIMFASCILPPLVTEYTIS